ncbi:helicase HerA domain-containing protein [Aquirufa aurantiipilula]
MQLNIKQRFTVVAIYITLILGIGYYFSNDWQFLLDTNNNLNAVLIATGLSLILSVYITEPYFSKPVDVITRWIAIFLFLIGLNSKQCLSLAIFWYWACAIFIFLGLFLIFLHGFKKFEKQQRIATDFICKISRPEIVFTILYFDIVISFFRFNKQEYPLLIGFGFLLAINKPIIWFVNFISKQIKNINSLSGPIIFVGNIIGHDSTDLYKVEIETDNPFRQLELKGKLVYLENNTNGVVGIIIREQILVGKKWLEVLSLRDLNKNLISFDLKTLLPLIGEKSIFSKSNSVYLLNIKDLDEEARNSINSNKINANFKNLIGIVWEGSSINKIKFNKLFSDELQKERGIGEGSIVQTVIANEDVLYQIIDARTDEETLEFKDTHGFTIGTAQKLGKYIIDSNELNTVKWLPEIYTPIFLLDPLEIKYDANCFIGKLPNTNYGIPIKAPYELVTHNTAILGILGIGKSCLTFELFKKLVETTEVKIFCIDLTNQYSREIPKYISPNLVQIEFNSVSIKNLKSNNLDGNPDNPSTWGNEELYKQTIKTEIDSFIASTSRVITINPDLHNVSKAGSQFKITHKVELSPAEKVRIISERLIIHASSLGETADARYLIVFEEAHSLIPEWNSIANEGDKIATNGTAKVILQGRKYGLGSFVITQRTANISKSILNQCNTIFALRVFDDTGKQFLENYIGADYSNLLPTLEERHCVAIGKAMKLKQPVILELNNKDDIQIS